MDTNCEHYRSRAECGECKRYDVAVGQTVRVADEGSRGSLLTWFEGEVVKKTDGVCVVRVEFFGEATWERLKPKYTDIPEPAASSTTTAPAPQVATPAPTPAPIPTPTPTPTPTPSPIPLSTKPDIGSRVVVCEERYLLEEIFHKKQWTLSEAVVAKCGHIAKVAAVDRQDGTLRLLFEGPIDTALAKQWWPSGSVRVLTDDGAYQAARVAATAPAPTPSATETPAATKTRDDIEDALNAANHAVGVFNPAEPTREEAVLLEEIANTCAHGNNRAQCGKCPRTDLAVGVRVEATDMPGDAAVWFEGIVVEMHEFGYPKVSVESMESVVWERIRLLEKKAAVQCRHVDDRAFALMQSDPHILCGACHQPSISIGEDVYVSLDGMKWSEGTVILRHAVTSSLSIALKTQLQSGTLNTLNNVGGKKGFTWKYVKQTVAKARDAREFQTEYIMNKCQHGRASDDCGECPRRELTKRQRVCVSMDGDAKNRAVFEGHVTAFSIPDGAPLVTVESFGEMKWDRVWAPDSLPPTSRAGPAFLQQQAEARLPSGVSLLPAADKVTPAEKRRQDIHRHEFLTQIDTNRKNLKATLEESASRAEAAAAHLAPVDTPASMPTSTPPTATITPEAKSLEPKPEDVIKPRKVQRGGGAGGDGQIKPQKVLRQQNPLFNASMVSEMHAKMKEKSTRQRGESPSEASLGATPRSLHEGTTPRSIADTATPKEPSLTQIPTPEAPQPLHEEHTTETTDVPSPSPSPSPIVETEPQHPTPPSDVLSSHNEAEAGKEEVGVVEPSSADAVVSEPDTVRKEEEVVEAVREEEEEGTHEATTETAEVTVVDDADTVNEVVEEGEKEQEVAEVAVPEEEEEAIVIDSAPMAKRKPRKGGRRLPTQVCRWRFSSPQSHTLKGLLVEEIVLPCL